MDQKKLSRVLETMQENQIPQLLVSDAASIFYLTGRMISIGERMMVLYLSEDGNHKFIVSKLFPQSGDMGMDVVYYDDIEDCIGILASYMKKGTKIGIDKVWPAKFLLRLMATGIGTDYVDASFIVDNIRQIKSEEECNLMREASRLNDIAVERLIPMVTKGLTEVEMGEELLKIFLELGAEGHSFAPIIGYGPNAADPHHASDGSKGKHGDAVVVDIGCIKDGYCSDMTRTVFIGEASEEARKIYAIVLEANRRAIAAVKPGVKYCEIDAAARDYITEQGYGEYFTHRTGHNIGMEVHESGDVSSINNEVLKAGMIFSIEPGIYVPGGVGVRIEDLILVTEDGYENLNKAPKELVVVK